MKNMALKLFLLAVLIEWTWLFLVYAHPLVGIAFGIASIVVVGKVNKK